MVPSLPVTPVPAVAGPFTGGHKVAQLPLQFDLVEVSGTNQYKVNPWLLVSTVTPEIFAVFSAVPGAALDAGIELDAGALEAPEPWEPDEPHAAATSPAAANPAGASHLIGTRIGIDLPPFSNE